SSLSQRYLDAQRTLQAVGQNHVLRFYGELDEPARDRLLTQIEGIDWREIARLAETHVRQKPTFDLPEHVEPAPWYPHAPGSELASKYRDARALGARLVREGRVAAFTVAGGQGTRLGCPGPKGMFPATPIRELSLFAVFAEAIHK